MYPASNSCGSLFLFLFFSKNVNSGKAFMVKWRIFFTFFPQNIFVPSSASHENFKDLVSFVANLKSIFYLQLNKNINLSAFCEWRERLNCLWNILFTLFSLLKFFTPETEWVSCGHLVKSGIEILVIYFILFYWCNSFTYSGTVFQSY